MILILIIMMMMIIIMCRLGACARACSSRQAMAWAHYITWGNKGTLHNMGDQVRAQ